MMAPHIQEKLDWFSGLTPETLEDIARIYTDNASFKDPFNEVFSRPAIHTIFRKMFDETGNPRFLVEEAFGDDDRVFVRWRFECRVRHRDLTINGSSLLRFAADGRISHHRDYWDAAEEIYEKIPVLGLILRTIKRMA